MDQYACVIYVCLSVYELGVVWICIACVEDVCLGGV